MAIGSFTGDYDTKVAALARRRKMAELLQAEALKGFTPPPNGLAKTSIFQPLGQLAQGLAAGYMDMKAGEDDAALSAARQKGMSEQLDKLANGTELTIPGTLPHLPGVAPMTQEGSPVVPPPEGEPDLRQMLTQKLSEQTEQPGAATTAFSPLNKRDTIAETVKLGDIMGGTAGAAVSAKAIEAGIPGSKDAVQWKIEEIYDPVTHTKQKIEYNPVTNERRPIGGSAAEKSDAEKSWEFKYKQAKESAEFQFGDTMTAAQKDEYARRIAAGDITTVAGPNGASSASTSDAVLKGMYGGFDKVPKSVLERRDAAMKSATMAATPEPTALAPVNLPGVAGAEPAAAAPQPKMMPNQVDPAKIPAKQSEAQILTEQLALEKGLLASGENGPDQQYIHERNIKQITERLTKIGALPKDAAAAPVTPAAPGRKPMPDVKDPAVRDAYMKDDERNALYMPPPDAGSIGPPSQKWLERRDEGAKEITKQRDVKKLAPLETALKSFHNLLDDMAGDPKSGVVRTVDPATGQVRYSGSSGQGLNQLVPKWIQSQDTQHKQTAYKSMDNIFTQMRSGLAVTSQEMANKVKELGLEWGANDETYWSSFERFQALMDAENNAIVGQYPSAMRDYWNATKPEIKGALAPVRVAKDKTAEGKEAKSNAKLEEDARKRATGYIR